MGRTRNNLSDLFQDRLMTSSSSPPTIIALFCYSFKSWLTRQGKCILYPVTELLSMMSLRGVLRRGNLLRRTKKVNFARGSVLAFLCVLRELSEKKEGRLSQRTPSIAKGKWIEKALTCEVLAKFGKMRLLRFARVRQLGARSCNDKTDVFLGWACPENFSSTSKKSSRLPCNFDETGSCMVRAMISWSIGCFSWDPYCPLDKNFVRVI